MAIEDDPTPTFYPPMDLETYRLLGLDQPAPRAVNGHSHLNTSPGHESDRKYSLCPEAYPEEGTPKGKLDSIENWTCTRYPDTTRYVWIYLPAELPADRQDLGLIIFNDGQIYLDRHGEVRATYVLDTLHAQNEIAPTVGVFVTPGKPVDINPDSSAWTLDEWEKAATQRSIEYDALRPDYAEFLIEELLPFVEQRADVRFTNDPHRRICCGASSGGIAAFTGAWHFPDRFARVLSHVGSFTNLSGGHNYPWLIRTTPRKDIRVFLQSGENDVDNIFGDWALANKTMASALEFSGYDCRFEFGEGAHSVAHGGQLFAESIRWLLR